MKTFQVSYKVSPTAACSVWLNDCERRQPIERNNRAGKSKIELNIFPFTLAASV